MTHNSNSLTLLLQLRQKELDRSQAELASRQAVRERYQRSVERLETLWRSSSTNDTLTPALSLNCANYKQTVLQLASVHRADLLRHEVTVDSAQQAVVQASREHGALEQMLARQRLALTRAQNQREQKRQDEMAGMVWQRRLA
jgi:flagellar export protein FliJ